MSRSFIASQENPNPYNRGRVVKLLVGEDIYTIYDSCFKYSILRQDVNDNYLPVDLDNLPELVKEKIKELYPE